MTIREKLFGTVGRAQQRELERATKAGTVTTAEAPLETETGAPHHQGALSALRGLALQHKTPEVKRTRGTEATTFGAKLMGLARGEGGKKAFAAMSLGMSLFGVVQNASAEVVHVGSGTQVQQAAQKIAKETGQPYVQVTADKAALEQTFKRAEAGEISLKHLVLDWGDGSAPLSSWEWQQLQQQFPKAFEQVELVHVIGSNLQTHPFQSYGAPVFKNAKAIVAFDLSTAMEQGPASAWVLEQTTKAAAGITPGMSAQEALIHAKALASQGAGGGVATRVEIGEASHTQAPDNALSQWLDHQAQSGTPITRTTLEAKLKELAQGTEGLTDGMLGALASRLLQPGFAVDYDAARLGQHLVDVRRASGSEAAVKALAEGKVHEVRQQLAVAANETEYAQEHSAIFGGSVTRGLPLLSSQAIPTDGIQGKAFLVDGLGTVKNGEVVVQAIRHPTSGDGYQLTFKLGTNAGAALESFMNARGASLVEKTIVNQAPVDGRVLTVEKGDAIQASATVENQQPEMSIGPALRLEKPGELRLDFFPESMAKQSLRSEVHLQVYGKTDSERNQQLQSVLKELGLRDVMVGKPSQETEQKMIALRLLGQADPRAHHALAGAIERGEHVSLQQLHAALVAAEVPPAFLQQAYYAEAAPGHVSVIVPGQSEAYARRGVRALFHTMGNAETFAFIAKDGALMSTKDRLQVGKVFRGMSSDEDLRSGGADFVFTRQVTSAIGNPNSYEMRGGAIIFKADVLDRADWYAYSGDQYGTTLAGDRGKPSEAVRAVAQRAYDALKAKGDPAVQHQDFDTWFKTLVQSQVDHRENIFLPRPVGRHQVKQTTGSSNETMLEGTIPLSQMERFIVPNQESKDKVIAKLKSLGVTDINGQSVDEFVQVRDKGFFTEEELLRMQKPIEAAPGGKVTNELKDPRLQFYVRHNPTLQMPGAPTGGGTEHA